MMSVEPSTIVSIGNANRATAMLPTRKMSSALKLSTVSNTNPAMTLAVFMYCHAVQDVGSEIAVKLETVNITPAEEIMTIGSTEDSTTR